MLLVECYDHQAINYQGWLPMNRDDPDKVRAEIGRLMDNAEYAALVSECSSLRIALDFACQELAALMHRADTRGEYTRRQLVSLSTEAALRQGLRLLHK